MKKSLLFLLSSCAFFAAAKATTCPTLEGEYYCQGSHDEPSYYLTITQTIDEKGITVYRSKGSTAPLIADGVVRVHSGQNSAFEAKYWCEDEVFYAEKKIRYTVDGLTDSYTELSENFMSTFGDYTSKLYADGEYFDTLTCSPK